MEIQHNNEVNHGSNRNNGELILDMVEGETIKSSDVEIIANLLFQWWKCAFVKYADVLQKAAPSLTK